MAASAAADVFALQFLEVEPGAEDAPGATQDDDADAFVAPQVVEIGLQLVAHRVGDRVEAARPVQGQPVDGALLVDVEGGGARVGVRHS